SPVTLENTGEALLEILGKIGFEDEEVGAAIECGFDVAGRTGKRLDDNRDVVPFPIGTNFFEPLDPGLAGHIYVEKDNIGEDLRGGQINEELEAGVNPIQFIVDPDV